MSKLGRTTRESYIEKNGLLSNQFNPEEFSIRSANDERSVLSAYAYLLGLYPESIKNPKLVSPSSGKDIDQPFTQEQLETLRTDLGLDKVPIYGPDPKIFVEQNDRVLFSSVQDACSGLRPLMQEQVGEVTPEFDNPYGKHLYDDMAHAMKIPRNEIKFSNAYKWLDEYICAKAEGRDPKYDWKSKDETEDRIRRYYRDYMIQGELGRADVSRVLSTGLID